MDIWTQRIFAAGLITIVLVMLWYASTGQDGRVLDLVSGIIIGIMAGLGVSNAQIINPIQKKNSCYIQWMIHI